MMSDKPNYRLQQSDRPEWWSLFDGDNGVAIHWRQGRFNEEQEAEVLDDCTVVSATDLAHVMRLMCDWLIANHPELLSPMPTFTVSWEQGRQVITRTKRPRFRIILDDELDKPRLASALRKAAEFVAKQLR